MNIILCGLPKCGKSTIGKLTAKTLAWNFIDTDRLIENAYNAKIGTSLSCRQIYQVEGEPAFRELEQEQIASLTASEHCVIALGGGSLGNPTNVQKLSQLGRLIYLKASHRLLWQRIEKGGIPPYLNPREPKNSFYVLAESRSKHYKSAASFTIDTDNLTETETVAAILKISNEA